MTDSNHATLLMPHIRPATDRSVAPLASMRRDDWDELRSWEDEGGSLQPQTSAALVRARVWQPPSPFSVISVRKAWLCLPGKCVLADRRSASGRPRSKEVH